MTALRWQPDHVAVDRSQLASWLFQAKSGDRCLYHLGHLAVDKTTNEGVRELSELATMASEYGVANTQQVRGDKEFQYFAVRTAEPPTRLPWSLCQGAIPFDVYRALKAVPMRSNAISVAKTIEAELGTNPMLAIVLLDQLVRLKLVQRRDPSKLTPEGRRMLIGLV